MSWRGMAGGIAAALFQSNLSGTGGADARAYLAGRGVPQEDLDTFCLTKQSELMIEMDAYRHGQPSSGSPGGATTGVSDNRFLASNGFDEFFNNGIDSGPFGNVYTQVGGQKRNEARIEAA